MKRRFLRILAATVVAGSLAPALPSEETPEKAAQAAAEAWLRLVDSGKYAESWDAAASLFRQALTRSKWEEQVKSARAPLGKLVSRKLGSVRYVKDLPGAPPGEYVVIQYDASFEKVGTATERVTPMKDKDGVWRVSGYYIL